MSDLKINDIRCNVTEGGFACGPIDGTIIVSIQYTYNNETKWLSCAEFDSYPEFYLSNNCILDSLSEENEDVYEKLRNDFGLVKFADIELSPEYDDLFANIYSNINSIEASLLRCIITLIRCEYEDQDSLIKLFKSKELKNINIPISDVEEDYLSSN